MDTIQSTIEKLFLNKLPSTLQPEYDIKFKFGDEKNSKTLEAHKLILSIRSSKFNSMFKADPKIGEIKIDDISYDIFNKMLRYIYCDKISIGLEEIFSLFKVAKNYNLEDLRDRVIDFCQENLSINNSLIIYDQLLKLDESDLKEIELLDDVEDLIKMYTFLAFNTKHFIKISKETLIKLLESNQLFIKEYDLFQFTIKWIKSKHYGEKERKLEFNSIKHLIRFPIMGKQQFNKVKCSQQFELFNKTELKEFKLFFQPALKPRKSKRTKTKSKQEVIKIYDNGSDIDEINNFTPDSDNESNCNKTFSVNYQIKDRCESLIVKFGYDKRAKKWSMKNPFDALNNDGGLSNFEEHAKSDDKEFSEIMKKRIGENYNSNCLFKNTRRSKNRSSKRDFIHLFKIQVLCDQSSFDLGMNMELYTDGKKVSVNYIIYTKDGKIFFSFTPAIELNQESFYAIVFRNWKNYNFGIAFHVDQISTKNKYDDNETLDLKLNIDEKFTSKSSIGDLFFYYKI